MGIQVLHNTKGDRGVIMKYNVVYLAGGVGSRSGLGYPKQSYLLEGKPVMVYALEVFESMDEINSIIVVSLKDKIVDFEKCLKHYRISKAQCVPGGSTRQESVFNGLHYCSSEYVIIHESVRPFIDKEHVRNLIEKSKQHPVVVPCIPIPFTVGDKNNFSKLNRSDLVNVQLPQIFRLEDLKNAHYLASHNGYTDDSTLVMDTLGITPYYTDGLEENIKITTPLDIQIAEAICRKNRGDVK
jgi:2-C-methyl-D-erythritol 4-phosphate cytidylyltransferase